MHQDPVTKSQRITNYSGDVTSTIDLDPWGAETGRSSNAAFQPFQFARQLGREQGVTKVVIEGAERTTGANPGSIPRTVEIKVN